MLCLISPKPKKRQSQENALSLKKRNRGESYHTEKSNRFMNGRKYSKMVKCNSFQNHKNLSCESFDDQERMGIREGFFDTGNLRLQREWIARYVIVPTNNDGRNRQKVQYNLPKPKCPGQSVPVCRSMFLNTLGISHRQVRTVIAKKQTNTGVLEGDKRGGCQNPQPNKRQKIKDHLSRFPHVESHYCRSSSTCKYVSDDLTKKKMYRMFEDENPGVASSSLYQKVMRENNVKIHRPKKDMCGRCEVYRKGDEEVKSTHEEEYTKHRQEIDEVRKVKSESKEKALHDASHAAAVFDLQQNIYLPKSNRSEVYYKRRLACYNFTIYDLGTRDGSCYLSNESITKRGACEVSLYLYDYLTIQDKKGKKCVDLFCDGCVGQNKNSILPSMFHNFLQKSQNVEVITIHYFEAGHGQSEGDSIHSVIENSLSRKVEVVHPCQLSSLIAEAREDPCPYTVKHVKTSNILDWKAYGQELGMLKCRESDEGEVIDWTKFMVRMSKQLPDVLSFKISHCSN